VNWTHDGLQADLASHLLATRDRVVWEDMQLGPAGSPRPDVFTIPKSFTKFRPLAYEIKVSVADFRRDVTAGKWQSYLEFASGVTFAVPAGLINKSDVPNGCGLMIRGDDGWRTLKAPTLKVTTGLPQKAWLKLVIDGIDRQGPVVDAPRDLNSYLVKQKLRKRFGDRVAELVSDVASAEERLEYELQIANDRHAHALKVQRESFERERDKQTSRKEQVSSELALLAEALGVPGADAWNIVVALQDARRRLRENVEIERLTSIVDRVRRVVGESS
jgi:hypothetical protein